MVIHAWNLVKFCCEKSVSGLPGEVTTLDRLELLGSPDPLATMSELRGHRFCGVQRRQRRSKQTLPMYLLNVGWVLVYRCGV